VAIIRKTSRAQAPGESGKPDGKRNDGKRDAPIADRGELGEGNYRASREYNEATRRFVKSGRVADAARDAAPKSADDAAALEAAERTGRERAKGGDPVDPVPATPRAGGRGR